MNEQIWGILFVCIGVFGLINALLLKLKIVAKDSALWGPSAIGVLLMALGCTAMGLLFLYEDVLSGGVRLALGLLSLLFIAGLVVMWRTKARKTRV